MKDLNAGMYVRTNEGIRKIIGEYNEFYELNKMLHFRYPEGHHLYKEDIDKIVVGEPSYNIIDLIEVGDYVNGHKVILVNTTFTYASVNVETSGEATCEVIPKKDIKSVVTREQFENMKYEVE